MTQFATALVLLAVLAGLGLTADPPPPGKVPPPPKSGKYWVYFGTYTGGANGSRGIYRSELDAGTGAMTEPVVAAEVGSPSFLAIHPDGKTLYAVGEAPRKGGDGGGGVYAYRIDPATGDLTKVSDASSVGAGPCHISTDAAGQFAVVANYGGGSTTLFRLQPDGSLAERTAFVQHRGKSVNPKRQEAPHAHCGFFDATGNHVLVADLGLDQVLVYKLDRQAGTLTPSQEVKLPDGSGPRHFHLHPTNDLLFVCGELDSTANVVTLDLTNGTSKVVQSISTLPDGKPVPGNSTAEIRIHPSGGFVYVSNRGHNSIAAFGWNPVAMKLVPIGHATEGIKVPRNFNITPDGRYMLVASQDGNTVKAFEITPTGLPKPTANEIAVPRPVCVKFLAKP
jgi:6-phosphogluconolactonase